METKNKTSISKDLENKKIIINRYFNASVDQVWDAWTRPELLDLWWAPRPWKTKTKSMDFREGGMWLYAMIGPDGTEHWCKVGYISINTGKSITSTDAFCDASGNISNDFPSMNWKCEFKTTESGTLVQVEITFAQTADLLKIVEMGFEEGFTAALSNLDELFLQ